MQDDPSPRSGAARLAGHLLDDRPLGHAARRAVSLGLLSFACLIGAMSYRQSTWLGESTVSFVPDLVSTLYATLFVLPFYLRRILVYAHTWARLLSGVLNLTVAAIFLQMVLGQGSPSVLGLPMPTLLAVALGFVWLGIRPFAGLVWLTVLVLGAVNVQFASNAMGPWGWAFVLSALGGMVLQPDVHWGSFRRSLLHDFRGPDETAAIPPTAAVENRREPL